MLNYGEANGIILLTGLKMGYKLTAYEKEQAIILAQGDEISVHDMGVIDTSASRIFKQIKQDNRSDEAQTLSREFKR